jgi:hypothetical protein
MCNKISFRWILPFVFSVILISSIVAEQGHGKRIFYAVLFARNNIEYSKADTDKWLPIKTGDTLFEGDAVRTGWQSSVHFVDDAANEIILAEGTKITLSHSELIKAAGRYNCLFFRVITVVKGTVFLWSKHHKSNESFHIISPAGIVENKGTRFFVAYSDSLQSGEVLVTEGSVCFAHAEDSVDIGQGLVVNSIHGEDSIHSPQAYSYDDMKRYMDYFQMEQAEFQKFTGVYMDKLRKFKDNYNTKFEQFKKERNFKEEK